MKHSINTILFASSLIIGSFFFSNSQAEPAAEAAAPAAAAAAPKASSKATQQVVLPIAIVDYQQVMKESSARKTANDAIKKKVETFEAEISKQREALQTEEQALQKKSNVLTKEAMDKEVKKFREKFVNIQQETQEKRNRLEVASRKANAEIQKNVTEIVSEMAQEYGFGLALPSENILYADSGLNITAEVSKRLNKRLPKMDVKLEK
jgi:Skp family chaperone for outer membrane proteins